MFVTRFVFGRVEQWIKNLAPEFRNREFIAASLGLLRIIGLPTNFSGVIKSDSERHGRRTERLNSELNKREIERSYHTGRQDELAALNNLLSD